MTYSGTKQLIVEAERLLDENDTVSFIEQCIGDASIKSGRPRELSVRALMVALQVQVFEGRFLLRTVPGFSMGSMLLRGGDLGSPEKMA